MLARVLLKANLVSDTHIRVCCLQLWEIGKAQIADSQGKRGYNMSFVCTAPAMYYCSKMRNFKEIISHS